MSEAAPTSTQSAPPPIKKREMPKPLRKMDAVVVDIVRRPHDTVTLYLFVGDHGGYRAGQFISIAPQQFPELKRWVDYYELIKGKKELIRAYSMSSIPSEKYVSITVKAEEYDPKYTKYPPLLSPLLASGALKGREMVITGFTGAYTLPDDHADNTTQVLHLVAGSGVVPNYALLKDELNKPETARVKHTMIYVNKTINDIIFHAQLNALARAHPDRFELIHMVTREDATHLGANYHKGRPTLEFVQRYVPDAATTRVYACGAAITKFQKAEAKATGVPATPRFIEAVDEIVHALGITKDRFKKEEYG